MSLFLEAGHGMNGVIFISEIINNQHLASPEQLSPISDVYDPMISAIQKFKRCDARCVFKWCEVLFNYKMIWILKMYSWRWFRWLLQVITGRWTRDDGGERWGCELHISPKNTSLVIVKNILILQPTPTNTKIGWRRRRKRK